MLSGSEALVNTFKLDISRAVREERNRVYGVVVGIVTNNKDDSGAYRVKVRFPWLQNGDESGQTSQESDWCRVCTFMAGNGMGFNCLPEVGDEVLVAFEHGDMMRPYVVGSLWNKNDKAILDNKGGKNNSRSWKTRCGHEMTFYDDKDDSDNNSILIKSKGGAKIFIDDKKKQVLIFDQSGKNTVTIDSDKNKIDVVGEDKLNIKTKGDYTIDCDNLKIKTKSDCEFKIGGNLKAKADSTAKIESGGSFDLKAGGTMTIKGGPTVNIN
jgi:uncharacterized protein involved in type VI secretion and phage assembly